MPFKTGQHPEMLKKERKKKTIAEIEELKAMAATAISFVEKGDWRGAEKYIGDPFDTNTRWESDLCHVLSTWAEKEKNNEKTSIYQNSQ